MAILTTDGNDTIYFDEDDVLGLDARLGTDTFIARSAIKTLDMTLCPTGLSPDILDRVDA
jgi:hypothetical protein